MSSWHRDGAIMSLSRHVRITASVGKGGTNRRDDVLTIQERLNSNLPKIYASSAC